MTADKGNERYKIGMGRLSDHHGVTQPHAAQYILGNCGVARYETNMRENTKGWNVEGKGEAVVRYHYTYSSH